MAIFNRRKNSTPVLPEEVQEYYQAERRERTGRAWLLALATLFVTFLLAAALFFGGRWVYRALSDNESGDKTTSGQAESSNTNGSVAPAPGSEDQETEDPETVGPGIEEEDEEAAPTPQVNGATNRPATTPATGPSELINTGPGDEL